MPRLSISTSLRRRPDPEIRRRYGTILPSTWVLLSILSCLLLPACRTVIRPPENSVDSVDILLCDYGSHASLAFPRAGGDAWVEYSTGEWVWLAQGDDDPFQIFPALLWPTQKTLCRWEGSAMPSATYPDRDGWNPEISLIPVSRQEKDALLVILDAQYAEGAQRREYRRRGIHLTFVPMNDAYYLLNNCNHDIVRWLELLGCNVSGPFVAPSYRVDLPSSN